MDSSPQIQNSLTLVSFQTCKTFVHLQNTNEDILDEIGELSDPL